MAGSPWGNGAPTPSPNTPTLLMPPNYQPPRYPPAPPRRRRLSCAVIGLWVVAAVAAILFLIFLVVFLGAKPSELDQFACAVGNQASCQRWRVIGGVRVFSAISCVLLAIVGGICGIIALIATLNRD